jgi:hypothetical protein
LCIYSTPINLWEDNISTDNFVDFERSLGKKAAKWRSNKQKSKDGVDDIIVGLLIEINERRKIAI